MNKSPKTPTKHIICLLYDLEGIQVVAALSNKGSKFKCQVSNVKCQKKWKMTLGTWHLALGTLQLPSLLDRSQTMLDPAKNKIIIDYFRSYHPGKIMIFGLFARNENRPDSDLDILINLNTPISLFQIIRMERELSELLGVKVHLVTDGAIQNPKLRNYIESDLIIIFQA